MFSVTAYIITVVHTFEIKNMVAVKTQDYRHSECKHLSSLHSPITEILFVAVFTTFPISNLHSNSSGSFACATMLWLTLVTPLLRIWVPWIRRSLTLS